MDEIFAASEIVELGIEIEINGRDFYDALYEKSKDTKRKEVFVFLRDEEKKHIETFKSILDSARSYDKKEELSSDEYFSYMRTLADKYVFTKKDKGKEIARGLKDEKEAVELGIGFERDSITFYEGMKKIVPGKDKTIVDKLILEEKNHLRKLTELKERLL